MSKKVNGVKARIGQRVTHLGKNWTVTARDYDSFAGQSFYLLRNAKAKVEKWARSDTFAVAR